MKRLIGVLSVLLLLSLSTSVYAFEVTGATGGSGGSTTQGGQDLSSGAPELKNIITPVIRAVNIALALSGIAFIIMLFWSGYRYSLSQGDPKAMLLAKESLTHALQGFFVVIGAFAIITIAGSVFGIDTLAIGKSAGQSSQNAIQELVDFFKQAQ
jgi:hypothetical protein